MFESDDYDQVLSQLDFTDVISTQQHVTTAASTLKVNNVLSDLNKLVQLPLHTESVPEPISLHKNETICVEKKSCLKEENISPKHTKRKLIDSHFDYKNKRKFPGPAGLLTGNLEVTNEDNMCQIELFSQDIDSSQNYLQRGIFETSLWKKLIEDTKGLNCNTIKLIKQQALAGHLRRRKADTVLGFIESIDRSDIDPLLTLRDTTGHIKCTLHRDAWSHFSSYIVSECCALVLKKPTVLTTGSAFKKHYLNITLRNISYIYSTNILDDTKELPEGFVKILEENFTLIKCEKQMTEFDFSPSNEMNEAEILEGLDGAFSDIF